MKLGFAINFIGCVVLGLVANYFFGAGAGLAFVVGMLWGGWVIPRLVELDYP
jgi:hypothetical protein